jgi:RHS repeat-associated protein
MRTFTLTRLLPLLALCWFGFPAHATDTVTYYHLDAQGSPVAATDEQGNVIWREDYNPYGDRIGKDPAAANNTRWYTGHPHDEASGLTYMGARWYDPTVGRFMGVDPKNFSPGNLHSFNRYGYGNNNPYKYVDPDGESAVSVLVAVVIWAGFEVINLTLEASSPPPPGCMDSCAVPSGFMLGGGPSVGRAGGLLTTKAMSKEMSSVAEGVKDLKPTLKQVNPRNLIPTQTRSEIAGSQVKKLANDMKKDGFDQSKPVDVWRNPNTGRLEIQDGHHRTEAAKKAGLDKIPVRIWE